MAKKMTKALKPQKKHKHIGDYLHREDGQAVSVEAQWEGVLAHQKLTEELKSMRDICDVFEKSGLTDAGKEMQRKINEKEIERKRLELKLNDERIEMSRALLVCLAACDVATSAADFFAEVMHRTSHGIYGADNDFSQQVREQANAFNKIVQNVDEGGNYALSMFYSDIADEVVEKVLPIIKEIVDKYHKTEKGRRYF